MSIPSEIKRLVNLVHDESISIEDITEKENISINDVIQILKHLDENPNRNRVIEICNYIEDKIGIDTFLRQFLICMDTNDIIENIAYIASIEHL